MNLLQLIRCYRGELRQYDREIARQALNDCLPDTDFSVDDNIIEAIIACFDDGGHPLGYDGKIEHFHFE
jgi:hypothetical protein